MCTGVRFNNTKGDMYFGRNLDWYMDYGEKITITPRNYRYSSAFLGEMAPKAGAIIGMAIIEDNKPLYFDCANEAGLAVAGLNFPGYAKYAPTPIDGRINVATYEFPLWLLLNFSSVEEVINILPNVAIVAQPVSQNYPVAELHFLIADKNRSIVVEYTEKGMEIFDNPVDILTNQPGYAWHRENLRNYLNVLPQTPKEVKWGNVRMTAFGTGSLMHGLPGDYYPTSRFVRAAYLNTHYPIKTEENDNISRLFHTLSGVAMVEGASMIDANHSEITIYTSGYSTGTKTYYYRTYQDLAIKSVSLPDYNLDSSELVQV